MIDFAIFTVCTFLVFGVPAINRYRDRRAQAALAQLVAEKRRLDTERERLLQYAEATRRLRLRWYASLDSYLGIALRTAKVDEHGHVVVLLAQEWRQ